MIYQSTVAFDLRALLGPQKSRYDFIKGLELSSGNYIADISDLVSQLSKNYHLAIHNYFPVPKDPFVLNLSTEDKDRALLSIEHAKGSIDLAERFCEKFYSIHAGFLLDPEPSELGNIENKKKLIDRKVGLNLFVKRVNLLAEYGRCKGVKILIENNVCSATTLARFDCNPLLFSDFQDIEFLLANLDPDVGFLVDFAHLKVSSTVLKFSASKWLNMISPRIFAAHLSENDGYEDQNLPFDNSAWFWNYLSPALSYYSIEVYSSDPELLKPCHLLLKDFINET